MMKEKELAEKALRIAYEVIEEFSPKPCATCKDYIKKDRYCKLLQINWIPDGFGCVMWEGKDG